MRKKIKQYIVLGFGLAMAGGFLFGGMFFYASSTPGGGGSPQNQGDAPELPNSSYSDGESFSYGFQTQGALAYNNNVVFVTGVYETEEDKQALSSLESLSQRFEGGVHVQVVNQSSTTSIIQDFGIVDYPQVVVVGGQPITQGGRQSFYSQTLSDFSDSSLNSAVCGGFRDLDDELAAICV